MTGSTQLCYGLKKVAVPEFENKQVPEFTRAITNSISVLNQALPHSWRVEIPTLNRFWLKKDFQQSWHRFLSEPMNKRHRETLFLAIENVSGNSESLTELFQDVLRLAIPQLPSRRQFGYPLSKVVVQQWSPHFERSGHTHSINFGENVTRQVSFGIQVKEFAKSVHTGL